MAGWSRIAADGSALDCSRTPQKKKKKKKKIDQTAFLVEIEPPAAKHSAGKPTDRRNALRCRFEDLLKSFVDGVCALDSAFWPLPPILGNGQSVDLLKLFLVVRGKGGKSVVCEKGLWDLVAKESGLGSELVSSVKLLYTKYLDALETWLDRTFYGNKDQKSGNCKDCGLSANVFSPELEVEFERFLSELGDVKYLEPNSKLNLDDEMDSGRGGKVIIIDDEDPVHIKSNKTLRNFADIANLSNEIVKTALTDSICVEDEKDKDDAEKLRSESAGGIKACNDDETKIFVVEMDGSRKFDDGEDDGLELDSQAAKEIMSRHKRKRESMSRMLEWVTGIAKNPCDAIVAPLPERSKWKSYGNEQLWKQVLLVREALLLKRHANSCSEPLWQKNQKMHPSMYEDHVGSGYNFRERSSCSKKLSSGKASTQAQDCSQTPTQVDSDSEAEGFADYDSLLELPPTKQVPVGSNFQATVPEWTGMVSESDSKWLGIRAWPVENVQARFVIEREPIGKGRQSSCGCEVRNSVDCVRFHIAERRLRMRRELGMAFYRWRFNEMGEEVKLSWKAEEEEKFKAIVSSNPPSLGVYFWDEIFKCLYKKGREKLVSYYFNVFLLERRANQNRSIPVQVDSDDGYEPECEVLSDLSENGIVKSPGSLLSSAKKPHRRVK